MLCERVCICIRRCLIFSLSRSQTGQLWALPRWGTGRKERYANHSATAGWHHHAQDTAPTPHLTPLHNPSTDTHSTRPRPAFSLSRKPTVGPPRHTSRRTVGFPWALPRWERKKRATQKRTARQWRTVHHTHRHTAPTPQHAHRAHTPSHARPPPRPSSSPLERSWALPSLWQKKNLLDRGPSPLGQQTNRGPPNPSARGPSPWSRPWALLASTRNRGFPWALPAWTAGEPWAPKSARPWALPVGSTVGPPRFDRQPWVSVGPPHLVAGEPWVSVGPPFSHLLV